MKGGVCGGSLIRGVLKLDQEIEIRPGVQVREDDNKETVTPTRSKILSLKSDKNNLQVSKNILILSLRSRKAGRFQKLLGFAKSHSIVTRGSVSLTCATKPHPFLLF